MWTRVGMVALAACLCAPVYANDNLLIDRVEHHNVDNNGVNVHYITIGEGPDLLFVHGFPDFWYVWNHQIEELSKSYRCIALDTRGTNKSGQPEGVENYDKALLLSDIDAVAKDAGADTFTLIAHDWGGMLAWWYTMDEKYSTKVERLVMMNLTHPRGFSRTLANATPQQKRNTEYARFFQTPEAGEMFESRREGMAQQYASHGEKVLEFAKAAYKRSYIDGMLNFYKANYFKEPYKELADWPTITCPVLQFHGLTDTAVDKDGLSKTWDWISNDYTLVTFPGKGHTIQREAAEKVTSTIKWWLTHTK